MATIVEYIDQKPPENRYPRRIISPQRSGPCCFSGMEQVGAPQEDGRSVFQYGRCPGVTPDPRRPPMWPPRAEQRGVVVPLRGEGTEHPATGSPRSRTNSARSRSSRQMG